ncbi:MAG: carbohydrate kinase family protein [Erysipelotrichaceae bacterium]|nr:carbohydrate kinase family protein [Erysipelotrichaceae bacterium]
MHKIYIVGGANIDIQGVSLKELNLYDSNIGKVTYSFGGVGRNIAENLQRLRNNVALVTVFADDGFGQQLQSDCRSLGIDISLSMHDPRAGSSVYLAVLDNNHDMLVGIADMDILQSLNHSHLEKVLALIDREDLMVIDTNLDKEAIHYLLTTAGCPIFVDPISTAKSLKISDELKYITMLKPNRLEAESLCGFPIVNQTTAYQALDYFLSHGVKEIVITLGKDGILASDGQNYGWYHQPEITVVSATGAGDAFLAGYIDGWQMGLSMDERLKRACVIAQMTLSSNDTVSKKLTTESLAEAAENFILSKETL